MCTAIFYTILDFEPPYFTQRHWTDTGTLYRHTLTTSLDRYWDFVPPPFAQRHWTDTWTLYRHFLHNVTEQILGLCTAIFYTTSLNRYLNFVPPYFAQRHWTDTGTLRRHISHNVIGQVPGLFQRSVRIVQELCESRGDRPGLSVLTSLMVSEDVKQY